MHARRADRNKTRRADFMGSPVNGIGSARQSMIVSATLQGSGMKRIRKFRLQTLAFVIVSVAATPLRAQTSAEIDSYYPDLQTLYQDLHRNPELAFQELRTAAKLTARLTALGYDVTGGVAPHGHRRHPEKRRGPDGDAAH